MTRPLWNPVEADALRSSFGKAIERWLEECNFPAISRQCAQSTIRQIPKATGGGQSDEIARGVVDQFSDVRQESSGGPDAVPFLVRAEFWMDGADYAKQHPKRILTGAEVNVMSLAFMDEYRAMGEQSHIRMPEAQIRWGIEQYRAWMQRYQRSPAYQPILPTVRYEDIRMDLRRFEQVTIKAAQKRSLSEAINCHGIYGGFVAFLEGVHDAAEFLVEGEEEEA